MHYIANKLSINIVLLHTRYEFFLAKLTCCAIDFLRKNAENLIAKLPRACRFEDSYRLGIDRSVISCFNRAIEARKPFIGLNYLTIWANHAFY